MRLSLFLYCLIFLSSNTFAQDRPVLQWQKNYGGSLVDYVNDFIILPDGSFIVLSTSNSNDGDISGLHGTSGASDISVIKMDPAGNIIWQKLYGGSYNETASSIIQTNDGGFIFIGNTFTFSNDGDVSGHHGNSDIWVVKLDASGNLIWQKCYGGLVQDHGVDILETANGFLILGNTSSNDGDVSGNHGGQDVWVIKTDNSGNPLWQRTYGGTMPDYAPTGSHGIIQQTPDGNFIIAATTSSLDGDVTSLPPQNTHDTWIFKITPTGTIIWDKCFGGQLASDLILNIIINNDGSFFISGYTYSPDLPGAVGNGDAWALHLDAAGNTLWIKIFGGTGFDRINGAIKTPDGGYLLTGYTSSVDGIVCPKHLLNDMWFVKLDAAGNVQWNRTYGGSKDDYGTRLALNSSGDCFIFSSSFSGDGDLTNNKGSSDLWLTKFSFTGPLIRPSVTISSGKDSIACAGTSVEFFAVAVNGGTNPSYQWKLNGVNIGGNTNTITISSLQNNDIVSCVLTSNDPCIDIRTAVSNNISVKVNTIKPPADFLPKDTSLCSYQRIELGPNSTRFTSFLWNDGSTTQNISVKGPGSYWLQVTDRFQCTGRDTVTIFPKNCIEGVFVPNAFTPNRDGYNDVFMPIMNADVKAYKFVVYDRWGRVVFQTTTLNKGWDGKVNGLPYDTGVFVWQCQYQIYGEEPTSKRGTVLLLK
jgi:gliding motility-associated-like protein